MLKVLKDKVFYAKKTKYLSFLIKNKIKNKVKKVKKK